VPHCIGLEGSIIGKVVGSWSLKDLNDTSKGDASMPEKDNKCHQSRAMCLNLLHKIQLRLSLLDNMPWKLGVLRVMLACIDTNAWWSRMGEEYNFNTQVLSIDNGLNIYYKLVLADDGAFHLLKTRNEKEESKNTPLSNLSEEMTTFVSGVQELMSVGTVKRRAIVTVQGHERGQMRLG
jgi:hypothetical protein